MLINLFGMFVIVGMFSVFIFRVLNKMVEKIILIGEFFLSNVMVILLKLIFGEEVKI